MQPSEAQTVIDHAVKLFPGWNPQDEVLEQWRGNLANHDYRFSLQAVDAVWRQTKRASLVYSEFTHEYAAIAARSAPAKKPEPASPYTGVWIYCYALDEHGHGTIGRFVPVGIGMDAAPERLKQIAQQDADRHTASYGGVWAVYEQCTVDQIMAMRWEQLGIRPVGKFKAKTPERAGSHATQARNFFAGVQK